MAASQKMARTSKVLLNVMRTQLAPALKASIRYTSSVHRPASAQVAHRALSARGLHNSGRSVPAPPVAPLSDGELCAVVAWDERAHPDKPKGKDGKPQGEDAQFHVSDTHNGHRWTVCGIADGVGGWASEGIDAGVYARELMANARSVSANPQLRAQPEQLLHTAHSQMSLQTQGSCTAVIAVFESNKLRVANLGDSGVIGYRALQSEAFIRTKEQQHRFNCPLQLGSGGHGDSALQANLYEHDVEHNDIIVLATDGFFDNLFDSDILSLIRNFCLLEERKALFPKPHAASSAADTAQTATTSHSTTSGSKLMSATASSSPSAQQHAGLHNSAAELAASLSVPRVAQAARAFPAAPLEENAGPVEKTFLFNRGLSTLSGSGSATGAQPSRSLSEASLKQLAEQLVQEALRKANGLGKTPFSEAAARSRKRFQGGKLDDITVVVAQLQLHSQMHDGVGSSTSSSSNNTNTISATL